MIGLGVSGQSAARYCAEQGASVVAVDEQALPGGADLDALRALGVEVSTGTALPNAADFDLVVPSPGVPRARYAGAERVWGDVELAARALKVPLIAVTGTNGKSTTVMLVEAMLRSAGLRARAAGNIGVPALELAAEPLDAAVLEVSSFQLETVDLFHPRVAVFLNASPDHIDRHGSFDEYVSAKSRIFARQEAGDVTILNVDDPVVGALAGATRARVIPVSRTTPQPNGVSWDAGRVLLSNATSGERIEIPLDGLAPALQGVHNLENILAALAAVWAVGADPLRASRALLDFEGLPHRSQEVAQASGVRFVDDSKATNAGAAARALQSFGGRALWIAGGRAKGTDFADLADVAVANARAAFLIGEAGPTIETALAGRIPTTRCESIEAAVQAAAGAAESGDVVLLAPGCASFDQFANFGERGDRFAAAARAWASPRRGDRT